MIGSCETTILIPSSITMESRDERLRTMKVGMIARAAAVFRVDRIVIYHDDEFDDSRFISLVLRYAETPQYLRKLLFPRKRELRYVGILPPLRTAHHPVNSKSSTLKLGEFRVGVVVESVGSDGCARVEIGVERPVPLHTEKEVEVGQRLNVRIFSQSPLAAEHVNRNEIPDYWGYEVIVSRSLEDYLTSTDAFVVATSRQGRSVTPELLERIGANSQEGLAVVFGSPAHGVDKFLSREKLDRCCMINSIPHQGTKTVRLEEAVFATLALLNLMHPVEE
jgi:predicted SPOUT superfamily RNA methylase MTH1